MKLDDSDRRPGFKFADCEMRGIPLRVELGPKDIAAGQCVLVRRDTREKIVCPLSELEKTAADLLETIQKDMYDRAKEHRDSHTYDAQTLDEMKQIVAEHPGFIRAMWCGDRACEDKIKEEAGITSRCIPFHQVKVGEKCVCCGKPASKMLYWGVAY